jgi:hypothetical protein
MHYGVPRAIAAPEKPQKRLIKASTLSEIGGMSVNLTGINPERRSRIEQAVTIPLRATAQ